MNQWIPLTRSQAWRYSKGSQRYRSDKQLRSELVSLVFGIPTFLVLATLSACTGLTNQPQLLETEAFITLLSEQHEASDVNHFKQVYNELTAQQALLGTEQFQEIYREQLSLLNIIAADNIIDTDESSQWLRETSSALSIYQSMRYGNRAALDKIATRYLKGQPDSAFREIHTYLQLYPNDDWAWSIKGRICQDLKDRVCAHNAFQHALSLNKENYFAHTGLGSIYQFDGHLNRAKQSFLQALTILPSHAPAHSGLSNVLLYKGELESALHYAYQAHQLDSQNATYAANLALVYHYTLHPTERDYFARLAEKLGYRNMEDLENIFIGKTSLLDFL
ncbi:tetratricopeptide TPR_2 repeat protein [Oleiphilus messinensis]|uniref:Tetratricopeptide TPR_2 repeat protein n=1 Tax=Oleiphilus messinensis TaxID=141451 RepID=A0A1Y0IBG3_9GAMM|nr:hypothetical protein [Oleiphilus messinensis]ARU57821.1 tetratricopeptide TPR_2 repeat protein [Oleiphilus messinensis]